MKGVVIKSTGSWYEVKAENGEVIKCRLKGLFRLDESKDKDSNPIAVGDKVTITSAVGDDSWMIEEIEKRENYIVRVSPKHKGARQIIAANLDQALLIVTMANPRTSTGFIDRFLISCEAFHIPAIIVFNKSDIYGVKEMETYATMKKMYEAIGYQVHLISVEKKEGLDLVQKLLKNKTTLISGHSGVGKSSLINYLFPHLDLNTQEVSDWSGKGLHTTTFAQMYDLPEGGSVIDTPGMRELGLVNLEKEELAQYFPEMRAKMNDCQFNNCQHMNEPGCAVKAAVEKGIISEARFYSYVDLWHGMEGPMY